MKQRILSCGCHKVNINGDIFSRIKQFSQKGKIGIQTVLSKEWTKLNPTVTKSGYKQCIIHGRIIRVNRLIAFNFIPNHDGLPESQHKNDIKTDNRVSNLKWGTQQDNANDREKHGNTSRGIKNPNSKLNNILVKKIRNLRPSQSLNKLAKKFNVSKKLILLVCQRKIWKQVE